MVVPSDVIIWIVAFVALWWGIDWFHMRQDGEPLPMRRAPLRVLADILPKVWRNKTFILALACLWLIGAAVQGVTVYYQQIAADPTVTAPGPPVIGALSLAAFVPEALGTALPDALPRLVEVPLGAWAALLFAVLLIAAMVRIIIDPPDRIGEETARKLRWPTGLLIAYVAAGATMAALPRRFIDPLIHDGGAPETGAALFAIGTMVLMPALFAPAFTILWRLVLEIACQGVWSFVSSMRAVADAWLPITLLVILANALRPVVAFSEAPDGGAVGYVYLAVLVLLALAPWAILDRGTGVGGGVQRSWELFRQKPVDLIAFALRFTLMFSILGALVTAFEAGLANEWGVVATPLLDVLRNALLVLQVLVLARLYAHLTEMLSEDDACATCPGARMAERLEDDLEGDR